MVVKVLNMMRNGSVSEIRFTKSAITKDRMVVVQDDKNKTLWIFTGENLNSEIKRLAAYSIDDLVTVTKYNIHEVSDVEWNEKAEYLFNLSRDPNYSKTFSKETKAKNKYKSTGKQELSTKPSHTIRVSSGIGFAPTPPSRQTMKASVVNEYIENKSVPTKVIKEKAESQERVQSESRIMKTPTATIPAPPEIEITPESIDFKLIPVGDRDTGPIIEDFQIAYYEQSGGENFIIIEELSSKIVNVYEFTQIKNLISAINELVDRNSTQLTAGKVLNKQLEILIKSIFRN